MGHHQSVAYFRHHHISQSTPSWKVWSHHRLIWLPVPMLWIPASAEMTAKNSKK